MAVSSPQRLFEPVPIPQPAAGRTPPLRLADGAVATDFEAEPGRPVHGVHRGAVALVLIGVVVFLLGATLFLSGDPGSDLNIYGVAGFAVIFFSLIMGLGLRANQERRWGGPGRSDFKEFVEDNVSIATGTIAGHEALVQILVLPAVLSLGMVAIGLIFLGGW
jgi:hypothetical protein